MIELRSWACRLAAMNALARMSWTPKLELWTEAGTIMDTVSAVMVTDTADGETFPMYYIPESGAVPGAERDKITMLLSDPRYECAEVLSCPMNRYPIYARVSDQASSYGPSFCCMVLFEDKKAVK